MAASVLASVAVVALAVFLVLGGPLVVLAPLLLVALFAATFGILRSFDRGRFRRRTAAPSSSGRRLRARPGPASAVS